MEIQDTQESILNRIVKWNVERQLIKKPDLQNETAMLIEEIIEMNTPLKSKEAREEAKAIASDIKAMASGYQPTPHQAVDAACDLIVFATGLIRKLGYDPDKAMDEVLKEIESRVGGLDSSGKWVKDESPSSLANQYKADFKKAKEPL